MTARSTPAFRPPSAAAVQLARTIYGAPGDDRAARPCDPEFRARIRRERAVADVPAPARGVIRRPTPLRLAAGLAVLLALIAIGSRLMGTGTPFAQAAIVTPEGELGVEPMPFEQQGQSFPGSAFYYLDASADTAPVPLPGAPLAPQAHWDSAEPAAPGAAPGTLGAGPSAQALRQAGTALDRTRALTCLTAAIYYEAASEPDDGQRAVAQVILNRMAHPAFPKTVCGVVYQGSERTTGCQFTFTCDGSLARRPAAMFWNRAEAVARAALGGFVYASVGLATHYHTFAVHPYWDASMNFLGQIGAHRFYRMQGPAGAAAAFRFAYAGGEPLTQGRLTRAVGAGATSPDPVAIERTYEASLRAAHGDAQAVNLIAARSNGLGAIGLNGLGGIGNAPLAPAPAYANEGLSRGGDTAFRARALPGGDTVRPEYQQSGAWITQPE
jgi:hypothetical protein